MAFNNITIITKSNTDVIISNGQDLSCDPNSDDGKTHRLARQSPLHQILLVVTINIIIISLSSG